MNASTEENINQLLQMLRSNDEHMKAEIFAKLSTQDKNLLVGILIKLISESDKDIRYEAAETLAQIDPKSSPALLTTYLNSSDSTLRWVICGLLSTYGDESVVEDLALIVENDPEPDVRILASFALGRIGDKRAIPTLIKARENDLGVDFEGRSVSDAAADALKTIYEVS